jgi:hypothetical protein
MRKKFLRDIDRRRLRVALSIPPEPDPVVVAIREAQTEEIYWSIFRNSLRLLEK